MKGIILAGGAGSRLYPLTLVASKQLQPVYDKPMVYYPLTTLIEGGIRELCLISTPHDLPRFAQAPRRRLALRRLHRISRAGQARRHRAGVSHRRKFHRQGQRNADSRRQHFLRRRHLFMRAFSEFKSGETIFGYHVNDPERYGVVEFDSNGHAISIEEKPKKPKEQLRRARTLHLRQSSRGHRKEPEAVGARRT
jgi:glucose-1-phosphate thymidylyltransferase